jgi:hypothetical protein
MGRLFATKKMLPKETKKPGLYQKRTFRNQHDAETEPLKANPGGVFPLNFL